MKFIAALPVLFAFLVGALPAHAWTWPVEGPVLRPFNLGSDPYAAGQHRGIDVAAQPGAAVHAPASGLVSFAGSVPGNGKTLTISTADGYAVTLVHLGSIAVGRGASLEEGAAVGTIGPSGEAEHAEGYVHLGVRVASEPEGYVDPLSLLPARGAGEPGPAAESGSSEPDRDPPVQIGEGEPAPDAVSEPQGEGAPAPSPGTSEPSPPQTVEVPAEPIPAPVDVPAAETPQVESPVGPGQVKGGVPVSAPPAESGAAADEHRPDGAQGQPPEPVGQPLEPVGQPAQTVGQPAETVGQPEATLGPPSGIGNSAGEQPVEFGPPADGNQTPTPVPEGGQADSSLPPEGQEAENTPSGPGQPIAGTPPVLEGGLGTAQPGAEQPANVPVPVGENDLGTEIPSGTSTVSKEAPNDANAGHGESRDDASAPGGRKRPQGADADVTVTPRVGVAPRATPSPRANRPKTPRPARSPAENLMAAPAIPAVPDASATPTSPPHAEDLGWVRTAWPAAAGGVLVLLLAALGLRRRLRRIETAPHYQPAGVSTASAVTSESPVDKGAPEPTALDAWLEALLSSQPRCAAASPPRIARAGRSTRCGNSVRRTTVVRRRPRRNQLRNRTRKETTLRS
jgi:peptidase M23-like protein